VIEHTKSWLRALRLCSPVPTTTRRGRDYPRRVPGCANGLGGPSRRQPKRLPQFGLSPGRPASGLLV